MLRDARDERDAKGYGTGLEGNNYIIQAMLMLRDARDGRDAKGYFLDKLNDVWGHLKRTLNIPSGVGRERREQHTGGGVG